MRLAPANASLHPKPPQMEILGRWLATVVVIIALGAFLLAFLRAKESFVHAFESAVAISGAPLLPFLWWWWWRWEWGVATHARA